MAKRPKKKPEATYGDCRLCDRGIEADKYRADFPGLCDDCAPAGSKWAGPAPIIQHDEDGFDHGPEVRALEDAGDER